MSCCCGALLLDAWLLVPLLTRLPRAVVVAGSLLNNSDLTVGHSALDVMGSSGYLDDDGVTDDDETWPASRRGDESQGGSSANWVTQRCV